MKNSIFKSYTKKILKSEAFVSIIIVFVLALGIIGTSYALYMDVDTDTEYQLVEVGDLSISFENPDGIIDLTNMVPMDDEIALKSSDNIFQFYLYNKGNYTANYDIKLETLSTNQVETQYINYQFCKDNAQNCDDVKTLSDGNLIYTDELSPKRDTDETNPSAYYFLRIWINNKYQSTEGKTISLKVTVDAKNASGYLDNKNTLAGTILNNPNIKINNTTPDFSTVETEEKGLYKAADDYGISYYFRGAQSYNYVNFAGMCWRIVRIEGDGSLKVILEDRYATCNDKETEKTSEVYTGNWRDSNTYSFGYDDNYRVDLVNYSEGLVDSFQDFQITKLSEYLDKLNLVEWCYDNTIVETNSDGYEYYGAHKRIYKDKVPSLKCTGTKLTKYKDNTNMYVGTLTADEIVYAGSDVENSTNYNYYLMNNYASMLGTMSWWTLTPSYLYINQSDIPDIDNPQAKDNVFIFNGDGSLSSVYATNPAVNGRPAVSLASNTTVTTNPDTVNYGQPGSQTNPYVIN